MKAAKKMVVNNTASDGSLNMAKFMRALQAYRNSMIYLETGKTIAQTLLGSHLRDALPKCQPKFGKFWVRSFTRGGDR